MALLEEAGCSVIVLEGVASSSVRYTKTEEFTTLLVEQEFIVVMS